jgi:alpha,alpha-trehalose-phosphate synthase [UDP-forming]/trehalose-phosphatase
MPPIDWLELANAPHLGVLCDLDGTLIPFAATLGEAQLDEDGIAILSTIATAPGTTVAVISGRPRAWIAELAARIPAVKWVAEHGAWRLERDGWHPVVQGEAPLDGLASRLGALVAMAPGARLERKSWSVCVHWRAVEEPARSRLIAAAGLIMDEWLEERPAFERLPASEAIEVRHRAVHKGVAVSWLRRELPPGTRLIAIGDDQTDEDMFQAMKAGDVAVGVAPGRRPTHADVAVGDVAGARGFLRWLIAHRTAHPERQNVAPPTSDPARRADELAVGAPLVVVSNRLPNPPSTDVRRRETGGLVTALEPALIQHGGVWLGWSGHERDPGLDVIIEPDAQPVRASFHYPPGWRDRFYAGLCNGSLWPLLHGFPTRLRYRDDDWLTYEAANRAYAIAALKLAAPDAAIWLHDYHLLLGGRELRALGHSGPIGLFLHVPFPPLDVFETLPWAADVLRALLDCDVVGFHTRRWADNFISCARQIVGATSHGDDLIGLGDRTTRVAVIPVGIDPAAFAGDIHRSPSDTFGELQASLGIRRLILGVDRLDYTKGIPERLEAFGRLLETFPEWRRKVSMIQVSVPSRADVPEYADLRQRVENLVGRINGELGEADWVPVRYLYRSYDRTALAQLYRSADVALVTPLRDGMNLVAKEYIASQDPEDPGVLVLSRFAGAAELMTDAVLTNPFHTDGVARDLDLALRMPLDQRIRRWRSCQDEVEHNTAQRWASCFLELLAQSRPH